MYVSQKRERNFIRTLRLRFEKLSISESMTSLLRIKEMFIGQISIIPVHIKWKRIDIIILWIIKIYG